MKSMQLREAKAGLSALVEAAGNGEPTIITRHGKPTAMVVPIEEGRKLYPQDTQRNFVDFLLQYPGGIELERNESPSRDVEL
ncbi:MAG: type II toxin-antitoxin system Phd/YefM family antitoxin [Mesorhizobium sp.]|uniref:type II toxin-antitoxin system Phd/YefM family antitoxin n=1 Tax=unclassified Mesorhizobium TaxID=325217 RepID=UPI00112B3B3B|nr:MULTISPECIES: type II toxin-antitoxin system Phd/YefM family antitoxin [unclassified Mesorhizobium]MBN9221884.1 type II toxin-antitoxin system Phd/YefM family antitoxin [Mesorhizobium sp.]MBZ9737615.1 type II toxin-antitoxin system Phd/YefM family antitoxin [Mesorhizobium sp. CO1-1-4]MBZ9802196.1 type II toxin-antitoxin system Phd/YefM family antitoxin [Mesorhizobium sp. ES1-6]MBZ9994848.1 type II toxin-antitoxin system Phd/YefM family antitoxin [Mesorhizobium sp. BH1-1-4]TPL93452.1 type II